jgi:hypothetical protein
VWVPIVIVVRTIIPTGSHDVRWSSPRLPLARSESEWQGDFLPEPWHSCAAWLTRTEIRRMGIPARVPSLEANSGSVELLLSYRGSRGDCRDSSWIVRTVRGTHSLGFESVGLQFRGFRTGLHLDATGAKLSLSNAGSVPRISSGSDGSPSIGMLQRQVALAGIAHQRRFNPICYWPGTERFPDLARVASLGVGRAVVGVGLHQSQQTSADG